MGFNSVLRALQEVFPQIDARILKAVAIEHSKDADVAVEAVLVEVIPYISEQTTASCSSKGNDVLLDHSRDSTCLDEASDGSSYYDANGGKDQVCRSNGNEELASIEKSAQSGIKVGSDLTSHVNLMDANDYCDKVGGNTETEATILAGEYQESKGISSTTSEHDDNDVNGSINDNLHDDWENSNGHGACDSNPSIHGGNYQGQSCLEDNPTAQENSVVQVALSPVQEQTPIAPNSNFKLVAVPDMLDPDCKRQEISGYFDAASKKDTSVNELVDLEDESILNNSVTRSAQICKIELLEAIIDDARSNKKILFSAMESVISLMREVEHQEKAAEQAKEEAARGCLDVLTKVEDLKKMLQIAKEANDMHAGEVYGEKAILATEVRELQTRLLSLSDERDKSLAILDEMHQTLESRLTVAEKDKEASEQDILGKRKSAQNALAEQELIMEKVVEESKILKQEAEENSKLREFLMDRGRIVDMLQGEISVICHDVKLLKEKFDEGVPLSKSLSSSQTSCILASSSSSLKSLAPDQVPEQDDSSDTPKKTSPSGSKKTSPSASIDDLLFSAEERAKDDRNALVDDGWEFFDNHEVYL